MSEAGPPPATAHAAAPTPATAHVDAPTSATAHADAPTRSRTVVRDGARLEVVEVGEADRPAWVIAHGVGSSARFVLAAFATAVTASGRRLVTFDLRGHADSSPAPDPAEHHLDVHAADLGAVAAGTAGIVEVAGGISLGGHAAVRAASAGWLAPSAVLACLPAWTGAAEPGAGPHAAIAAEVSQVGIGAMVERYRADTVMPGWLRETLLTDYPRHDRASLAAALRALDGGDAPDPAELAALPVPLAVVGWPDDPGHPLAVARQWAQAAPRSALGTLRLQDLQDDLPALGRAAVRAVLAALDGHRDPDHVRAAGWSRQARQARR